MNFFEHQDRARRMTWRLIGLLLLAIASVVLVVYAASVVAEAGWHVGQEGPGFVWIQPRLLVFVAVATLGLMGIAALVRMRALDSGGGAIALSLGARQVLPARAEGRERVLLNVAEEMAIAAGMPVPYVFVLPNEPGINAFAAAASPRDAAVVVTQGALEHLDRDELQGVIGHEYSHLLNGDTRLNMRLVGLLHGLTVLGQTGLLLLRASSGAGTATRHRGVSTRGGGPWPLFFIGATLWLAGSLGLLAARIIKAAVSRQREFLADAAAVQFSRNRDGLAGALKKIGGQGRTAAIQSPSAEEFSHLFFSEAFRHNWLGGLFATHPPLTERIKRLDPSFRGRFGEVSTRRIETSSGQGSARRAEPGQQSALDGEPVGGPAPAAQERFDLAPESVIGRVGAPTSDDLRWGGEALAAMPDVLRDAASQPFDALALLYALTLHEEPTHRAAQETALARMGPRGVARRAGQLKQHCDQLDQRLRLPLVETLVPTLRRLSDRQRRAVMASVDALVDADGARSVFEYALRRMLLRRLMEPGARAPAKPQVLSIRPLAAACSTILSALAWAGHEESAAVGVAFRKGAARLPPALRTRANLREAKACTFAAMDKALECVEGSVPYAKRAFVDACAHCVVADGQVTVEEAELLRSVAEAVGCPIPPLLPR